MKTLYIFDEKDYNENWKTYYREAVRAVIIKNNKIAMVKSETEGFYKFPGGGIKPNETHHSALIRETAEETGLIIIPSSIKEAGALLEFRKSKVFENEIFNQKSYYYYAQAENIISNQKLDNYEKDLKFTLKWVDIETACKTNIELTKTTNHTFLMREAYMLNYLRSKNVCSLF